MGKAIICSQIKHTIMEATIKGIFHKVTQSQPDHPHYNIYSDNVIILYFAQSSLFTAVYPLSKVDLVISVHQMHSCVFCGHITYILMTMAIINLSSPLRRILHSFVSLTTSIHSFIFVGCH